MTERRPAGVGFETWIDRQIRDAAKRGEFDNLPGAGKPLGDLGDPNDPDWWVRNYIKREKLDISGALPTPLALRKEASSFPQSLADVRSEAEVREILEDFNHRVKIDRLRPAVGNLPPLLARTVDVDEVVEQWRELRACMTPPPPSPPVTDEPLSTPVRGWWRRLFGG
jgi:DnaJ homologue, subfamily C, member 28, conserved domain